MRLTIQYNFGYSMLNGVPLMLPMPFSRYDEKIAHCFHLHELDKCDGTGVWLMLLYEDGHRV